MLYRFEPASVFSSNQELADAIFQAVHKVFNPFLLFTDSLEEQSMNFLCLVFTHFHCF